jgi:uncharacterized membrane protein YkvA (DUF1232 family)
LPPRLEKWKAHVASLKSDTYALYLACRDPRVPWLPKLISGLVVAYALSPIDLIPDFIPVLGYVDDLILLPLGLTLAIRLIPAPLFAEFRAAAAEGFAQRRARSWLGAAIVITIWGGVGVWIATVVWRVMRG